MPARRILWFILSCIVLLGVIAYFYPEKGIKVGPVEWRFPSLHDVLSVDTVPAGPVITPEEQLTKMSEAFYLKNLSKLADSLDYYRDFFANSSVRIYFPEDDPSLFDSFFTGMDEAIQKGELIHIIHYGDSQIEQDRITGSIRNAFQKKFGGMGVGLVPAVQTIPTPYIVQEAGGDWQRYLVYGNQDVRAEHNRYGPMGLVCECHDTAFLSISARNMGKVPQFKRYTQIRLLVGHNDADFRVSLFYENQEYTKIIVDSCADLTALTWRLSGPVQDFRMTFSGNAEIYGLLLDGQKGVSVDNVPMRGCSGTIFTNMDANVLRQAYRAMNVKLFILEYGGNRMPSIANEADIAKYARSIGRQIRYLKSLAPAAQVLFIGPADMSKSVDGEMVSYPLLEPTIEALRKVCLENSAAFWDMYQVMGGHNSMIEWTKTQPPLAASDYVHFTYRGSQRISELLNNSLSVCYDYYHFKKHHLNDSIMTKIDSLDRNVDYSQRLYEIVREMDADSMKLEEEASMELMEMMRLNEQDLQQEEEE